MRFMLIVKASKESEAGVLPTGKELADMGKFNEQMVKNGMMLAGEGLQASSKGARITFKSGKPTVVDGPFAETKELVAGFWLIQAKSKEEAVEWARRIVRRRSIEVRQVFELEDFGRTRASRSTDREELSKSNGGRDFSPAGACGVIGGRAGLRYHRSSTPSGASNPPASSAGSHASSGTWALPKILLRTPSLRR